jgi:hypothetical protein
MSIQGAHPHSGFSRYLGDARLEPVFVKYTGGRRQEPLVVLLGVASKRTPVNL